MALLPYAMRIGEDVEVRCSVSEKLYYNICHYATAILAHLSSVYKPVKISALSLDSGQLFTPGHGVVTGVSGGIDSFCAVVDHYYNKKISPSFKLTHLIYNNVGSHGRGGSGLFDARFERIRPISEEIGLPVIKVDSNVSDFTEMKYQSFHSLANASSPMTLQKLFGKFLYASGYQYQDCFIGRTKDISSADPSLVHLLSTENFESIATGAQYARTKKTEIISRHSITYKYLEVCVKSDHADGNCSVCRKCFRTLFTLELLGELDKYRDIFDLEKYRVNRRRYLKKVRLAKDPLSRELRELAREKNFRFPWSSLIY